MISSQLFSDTGKSKVNNIINMLIRMHVQGLASLYCKCNVLYQFLGQVDESITVTFISG